MTSTTQISKATTEHLPQAVHDMRTQERKAVVVHSGARDAYQLSVALSEAGLLESLVTDLFWPLDSGLASVIEKLLPSSWRRMLLQRSSAELPFSRVRVCPLVGVGTLFADKFPRMSLDIRRRMTRKADATLGRKAGLVASRTGSAVVSYSYYGYDAFRYCPRPGMLFQLHPHPISMRRILTEELEAHPDCAESLRQEWELSLPESDFQHLVQETAVASSHLVASSFTRSTLVEQGIAASSIRVVPYGVDCNRFRPDASRRGSAGSKLHLLFVGRINQRKGIKYLLEALRLLGTDQVQVTICGRVVDSLDLFRPFEGQVKIRPSVGATELLAAYQAADLFVLPSVAEGFGQVLLESLACGLPVLSTTHTAAPDLIEEGREGFVVEPRRPDQIAHRLEWALTHRDKLRDMGMRARATAECFSWQRFRTGAAAAVRAFLCDKDEATKGGRAYV